MTMFYRRRQVMVLIPSLRGGGAERVIVALLRHLDRTKFRLTLAVVDMREAAYLDDVPDDVELIDLGCSRVRYALPKIIRLIWQQRPEVVFSTLGHLNLAMAIIRPLLPDSVRYVARETCVVSEVIRDYRRPSIWKWAYRRFCGRFDTLVCQSRDMRDDLIGNFGLLQDKAVVINNPVDVQYIRQLAAETLVTGFEQESSEGKDSLINLLAVGRLVPPKGFDLLIESLALCRDPRLRLTLLGEGPMREELEVLAHSKGLTGQVRFAGFQKNPYPFFAQADVFVLSSRFEGFPNVLLEALACGTPVVAMPALGGVREILQGVAGCEIAEAISSEAFASAINRCIARGIDRLDGDEVVAPYAVKLIVRRYGEVLQS